MVLLAKPAHVDISEEKCYDSPTEQESPAPKTASPALLPTHCTLPRWAGDQIWKVLPLLTQNTWDHLEPIYFNWPHPLSLSAEKSPAMRCAPAYFSDEMCWSFYLFQSGFFLFDASLQSLNVHVGFNSALKLVGGRCFNGNKAPNGLCGTGSQWGCSSSPGRSFARNRDNPELDPKLLRPGKAGRAPVQNQVSFIAIKLYVVKSKALVWGNWRRLLMEWEGGLPQGA